jgi:hypothetical protein
MRPLNIALFVSLLLSFPVAANSAGENTVASLSVSPDGRSQFRVRVTESPDLRRWLMIDCVEHCASAVHFKQEVDDFPLGLVDLEQDGLIFTVWGTGCCYRVRVLRVTQRRADLIFETGSRGWPNVSSGREVTIDTFMRPTDQSGREISKRLRATHWLYNSGRFVAEPARHSTEASHPSDAP